MSEVRGRTYEDVADYLDGRTIEEQVRVLVPLDGSPAAERAFGFLPLLSRLGEMHTHLVAVVNEGEALATGPGQTYLEREQQLLTAYLHEAALKLSDQIPAVDFAVLTGEPAAAIIDEASRSKADLILISTHGRSGLQRWRIGSVADKVIRGALDHTLVIGPKAPAAQPVIDSILVPLDGSLLAEHALPVAQRFAEALGAKLHLFRVIPPMVTSGDVYAFGYSPDIFEAIEESVSAYLTEVQKRYPDASTASSFGPPASCIQDYIEEKQISLVVMTSHGRGGVIRTALGSVTDRLIGGPAPVLIVRPESLALQNPEPRPATT